MSAAKRIQEAQRLLTLLNFDAERSNERSALVLLALFDLRPDTPWTDASRPFLRTVDIIDWVGKHYSKFYRPNTRETIRRRTLHQFVEAALIVQNPDRPDRPINSPQWCYQLEARALELARCYGRGDFAEQLRLYLAAAPGLRTLYGQARQLERIPVTLPGGQPVTLSPGGQNVLLRQIIEDFCPYYTPGGEVLYIGDADEKWAVFEEERIRELGVTLDAHGKMPDLVVYLPQKNWLVLLEAAGSHGPVDATRQHELKTLFSSFPAGIVLVSCFPSRVEMRKHLHTIAWETEVWCADAPTHLIHFNGERFLGPYD